jgi:hypothetical protein
MVVRECDGVVEEETYDGADLDWIGLETGRIDWSRGELGDGRLQVHIYFVVSNIFASPSERLAYHIPRKQCDSLILA